MPMKKREGSTGDHHHVVTPIPDTLNAHEPRLQDLDVNDRQPAIGRKVRLMVA
jgi:hypothetical protein